MQAVTMAELGLSHAAAALLNRIVGSPESIPRDSSRSLHLALSCEAAGQLGDRTAARLLFELLAPYRDQNLVVGSGAVCLGSANLYLGIAARAYGRAAEARKLFRSGEEQNASMGSAPLASRCIVELSALETGRTLPVVSRVGPHGRRRATQRVPP
jgi:hypothetical protein